MTTKETGLVFSPRERIDYSKNSVVSQQITKSKTGNITLFAFDQGQQLSEHSAPFDAVLQVLDGTALIHIAEEPHEVHEGEMIILPANIPHAVYATTAFKMILTMIRG
ncbi:cupin domain-containing protein [Sphingobacterium sp. BN32]|uniref:cupin domain-containing protein n=1 Tax=Sphingobacterium sp. BN32 TaxID=3058432 RepID=UPI00265CE2EA|nr:cupin domain-containing protein [Sphingobacterium sp. BN32]WKK59570.1 cupin domain-containing protein [Sphingobacterium sp. BN32]